MLRLPREVRERVEQTKRRIKRNAKRQWKCITKQQCRRRRGVAGEGRGEGGARGGWGHWTSERVNVNSFKWATTRAGPGPGPKPTRRDQRRCHFGAWLRILPCAWRSLGRVKGRREEGRRAAHIKCERNTAKFFGCHFARPKHRRYLRQQQETEDTRLERAEEKGERRLSHQPGQPARLSISLTLSLLFA